MNWFPAGSPAAHPRKESIMTRTHSWRRSALLALPIAALLLAGCSSADPEPLGETDSSGTGTEAEDYHAWSVKYATCMQDEGLDYPDPDPDPNAAMPALDIEALGGIEAFDEADQTCRTKIGDPPAPLGEDGQPISDEQLREEMLEFTKCLREQGVDIDDPAADGGITIDQSMPPEALEACGVSGVSADAG